MPQAAQQHGDQHIDIGSRAATAASDMEDAKQLQQEHHDNIELQIDDIDVEIAALQTKRENLVQQHPRIN